MTPSHTITATLVEPPGVPPAIDRSKPARVVVEMETTEQMDKGALGALVVTGDGRPGVFKSLTPEIAKRASGH